MATGTIVRLMADRGFGFIADDAGGELSFDEAVVAGGAFRGLDVGQRVQFARRADPRGHRDAATGVAPLGGGAGVLQVSDAARATLEGMRPDTHAGDADVLRLEVPDGVPAVRWDTDHVGDYLLRQRRRPLLAVAAPLAESLQGMTLDHVAITGGEPGRGAFSLRPSRP